jgi:hypothetical protein
VVLVECLRGNGTRDAAENRLLETCDIVESFPAELTRRAARLHSQARRGSAVDAFVVAMAEPGGVVLTWNPRDLRGLAAHALDVAVETV